MILAVTGLMVAMFVPVSNGRALSLALEVKQIWYVNKSPFILEGKAEPGSQVGIEGQNLFTYADDSGSFKIYLDVSEGGNFFQVVSQKGEQKTTKDIYVEKDSTPPVVTIVALGKTYTDKKINLDIKDTKNFEFFCFTDPDCSIKVDNANQVLDSNRFKLKIELMQAPSKNSRTINVTDRYGNETSIDLEINNIHTKKVTIAVNSGRMTIEDRDISINKIKIKNGTYMLNIRLFCEAINGQLSWDADARISIITAGDSTLMCKANEKIANFDGSTVSIDEAPFIENGTTHIPIKSFFTLFGYKYEYNELFELITLTKEFQP